MMTNNQDGDTESLKQRIIKELKFSAKKNQYISGEVLCNKLNISRSAVWKHIQSLRKKGYKIISATNKGYKLIEVPDLLLPEELRVGLETKIIGSVIRYFSELSSTNEEARRLADEGAHEGLVLIAETQSKGRGRLGRQWFSPRGGLWLTIVLRPKIAPNHAPLLTLLSGVAVARCIRDTAGLKATLKWPNDVRIKGKKVCGILTEMRAEQDVINYVLIGLGINVNLSVKQFPKDLRKMVTSIQEETNKEIKRIVFTQELLKEFEQEYVIFCKDTIRRIPEVIRTWRSLSDTLGRNVMVETSVGTLKGLAADIAEDGALVIITETGEEHKIVAGDCIYLNQ